MSVSQPGGKTTRHKGGLPVVGYCDRPSVEFGGTVQFMVSCESDTFGAEIIRVKGGGARPERGEFSVKTEVVDALGGKRYDGQRQSIVSGSHIRYGPVAEDHPAFTLFAWVYPTLLPSSRTQSIIAIHGSGSGADVALAIREDSRLGICVGTWPDQRWPLVLPVVLEAGQWYLVGASADADGDCVLGLHQPSFHLDRGETTVVEKATVQSPGIARGSCITIGAAPDGRTHPPRRPPSVAECYAGSFNGKVASPQVIPRGLEPRQMQRLLVETSDYPTASLISWPAPIPRSATPAATAPLEPTIVNAPLRAVTGPHWSGRHADWRLAPDEYDAIWFHDDDLDNALWMPTLEWHVPSTARSGIYAARVFTAEAEDVIPFVVRPPTGYPTQQTAFLAPLFTYLAYSNGDASADAKISASLPAHELTDRERFISQYPEIGLSLYDNHRDGSGISHVSWLRPLVDGRLDHGLWTKGGSGRELSGDLYLIDWLETQSIGYDVLTDADLHADGLDLLAPYKVIVTGGHPEYVSERMLDALERYVAAGGRVMYLGGNGFYWVTSVDQLTPGVLEVRRGHSGTRTWTGSPGEDHHTDSGEPGGLWRHRGRAPQRLTGVGFDAQGRGKSAPFMALPEARDPRWSFVFAGVDLERPIGDFGSNGGGAAGDELDRLDFDLGSPPGTVLFATSSGLHSDLYHRATEEIGQISGSEGGAESPSVRADMTYFENGEGGAVFSTGSIAWTASLAHNGYENPVARITENVLHHFQE
jgi:N,N-dimethylformamidase